MPRKLATLKRENEKTRKKVKKKGKRVNVKRQKKRREGQKIIIFDTHSHTRRQTHALERTHAYTHSHAYTMKKTCISKTYI